MQQVGVWGWGLASGQGLPRPRVGDWMGPQLQRAGCSWQGLPTKAKCRAPFPYAAPGEPPHS